MYIAFRGKHRQIERKRDIKGDRYRVEDTEGQRQIGRRRGRDRDGEIYNGRYTEEEIHSGRNAEEAKEIVEYKQRDRIYKKTNIRKLLYLFLNMIKNKN